MDPTVQILLKYADLFEILGPPSLPYCKCISRCEDVGYKRSIGLFHFIGIHPPLRRDNYVQRG